MRVLKCAVALLGVALVALPVGAAIQAMTLAETMALNTDVLHAKIISKTTVQTDQPLVGMVYTHMTVEGESLITGRPVKEELVFLGSHDPADHYATSEMPTLQDTRIGNEALIFVSTDKAADGQAVNRVFDLGSVYRVEKTFGAPVVIGKGEGFAFPENVKLVDASDQVRKAHLAQMPAK